MMPGDSQSKTVAIAADATAGNCQNCGVLHQSLTEYVSSFLALKQKITVSDDTIRLQQQLEELQIRLVTLERKTIDHESMQAELEEKKRALKVYEEMSEEMEGLKQKNSRTIAENKKLEEQLKDLNALIETQKLENAQLKREKAEAENDLLKTEMSLSKSQAQADQFEKLVEENAKTIHIKDDLENKVRLLEDSVYKQNHQIAKLSKEKNLLQRNIDDLQVRLMKFERERNKEYRSISTLAAMPEEPKVDKEKIRLLLENVWECVEPRHQHPGNLLHFSSHTSSMPAISKLGPPSSPSNRRHSTLRDMSQCVSQDNSNSHSCPMQTNTPVKPQAPVSLSGKRQIVTPKKSRKLSKEHKNKESSVHLGSSGVSVQEVMEIFKPLPPCISPLANLETEMDTMETDEGKKEDHPKPSDDSVYLQEEDVSTLHSTSVSSPYPGISAVPAEENVDLPALTSHEVEHISENNLSDISEMRDKIGTDGKDKYPQQDTGNEHLVSALSPSSSSRSDNTVLVEAVSLTNESQEPSCCINPCSSFVSSMSESVSLLEQAKEDQSETDTKMDVDTDPSDDTHGKTVFSNDGEPPRGSDNIVVSENTENLSSANTDSAKDTEVSNTENGLEVEKSPLGHCSLKQGGEDVTVIKLQEIKPSLGKDGDVQEDNLCSSTNRNNFSSVSNKTVGERLENDASINIPEAQHSDEEERSAKVDKTNSSQELHSGTRPPSPLGQESAQVNIEETPRKKIDVKALNCETEPDDLQRTVNWESLKGNTHFLCRQISPSCLLPNVKLQTKETCSSAGKLNVGDEEHIATGTKPPQPVPDLKEDGVIEKPVIKDCPQDMSCTTSSIHLAAAKDGQNKCLEACAKVLEKQSSYLCGHDEASPAATSDKFKEYIGQVRSEMGPPLPPIITPLTTPPKAGKSINPRQAIGKLSFPSPMDRLASPTTPVITHTTPNGQHMNSSSLNSPLHPNGVPLSPLQFCSATPKHAVPVPGRLPSTAMNSSPSSSSSPSQESSMRILDTMYPELSARARTLSILRGNVSLGICSSDNGAAPTNDSQISGFKTIYSVSTAFTKTETRGPKRQANGLPQLKNNKCPRLDSCSPAVSPVPSCSPNSTNKVISLQTPTPRQLKSSSQPMNCGEPAEHNLIVSALHKIENQCFDLLPVIQSHLFVGNLPKKPVLRDEEKEVIAEICQSNLADDMISAIISKLKIGRRDLSSNYMQALCRVYTGICRQRGHWERARSLAYNILAEDFPNSAKMILFIVTTWPNVLLHTGLLCQAVHTVTKLNGQEEILSCLSAFLDWKKAPPCDIDQLISRAMSALRSASNLSFIESSRHGCNLGPQSWEYVFTLHLLCTRKKWKWTYENLLGKELWPIMNTWVTQPRDQQTPISDATVATVFHLIGYLGQLGMKERCMSSVASVASVINTFVEHAKTEGVPWQVQLSAVYCAYKLSPCNPKQALGALASWREETSQRVPPAVNSCMNQLASICRQIQS